MMLFSLVFACANALENHVVTTVDSRIPTPVQRSMLKSLAKCDEDNQE